MRPRAVAICGVAIAALFIAACTHSGITPRMVEAPPPTSPKVLVVGDFQSAEDYWGYYANRFRTSIQDWYTRNGGFDTVITDKPTELPAGCVVLAGTITELDKGNMVLRLLIGMGAGRARLKGDFEIRNVDGVTLAKFTSHESYLGGIGIGGGDLMEFEDLVSRFAATVAATTRDWAQGKPLTER